ncbi:hypothetical protein FIBSPDRAFT_935789 [Athelia psychrophila]|uniref:Uncharacterized protein n=1 Tax=Athelia psychrophila TaxID=1759441 RepID=A0A166D6D8_9AGAM|nr:hypothetical protein FIBSPDRAFT_935789 [Fibularhizoctonia sp. CBS 109695]
MSAYTRNLNFSCKDLGKEATLLFTFDDIVANPKLFQDQYPVCWKVTVFGEKGHHFINLTYKNQLAFMRSQVEEGKITNAGTYKDINIGQMTALTVNPRGVANFSEPEEEQNLLGVSMFKAVNNSGTKQNISLAFYEGEPRPTAALYFEDVGNTLDVTAQFIPVLRLYITSDYKENAILRSAIRSPKAVWSHNLADLKEKEPDFVLTREIDGSYKVTPA